MFIYFERERETERVREGQREREGRERGERERIPSRLHTVSTEPSRGDQSHEPKSTVGHLTN